MIWRIRNGEPAKPGRGTPSARSSQALGLPGPNPVAMPGPGLAILTSLMLSGSVLAQAPARPQPAAGGVDPLPQITSIRVTPQSTVVNWFGLGGPFQLESQAGLVSGNWLRVGHSTTNFTMSLPVDGKGLGFFRVSISTNNLPKYLGAAVCARCHGNIHANWAQTSHAKALGVLTAIKQDTNSACLPCHTVGYDRTTGYKDQAATPGLSGVQCENCHGPGGDHAASPFEVRTPVIRLDSEMCGGCHNGFHHPTFEEWQLSKHARATPVLQGSPFATDDCLSCHSQDYRFAQTRGRQTPTVATAKYSLECSTCHDPHGATTQASLLRKPVVNLCGECHTQGEILLGQTPHHPQLEMLKGIGAFDSSGAPMTNVSTHTTLLAGNACAQCHVVKHAVAQPNYGNPVVTGHTFNPFDPDIKEHQASQYTGCLGCHSPGTIDQYRKGIQAEITQRLNALAPYFDANNSAFINPANLNAADQQRLKAAKFNYQFVDADGSRGVHNLNNTDTALSVSEDIVASLKKP